MKIEIYDTTLRDGGQGEGINLSLSDKLAITKVLDTLGVDYIEGGWPGSNPKDEEYFASVKKLNLGNSKVTAFGSTRKSHIKAEDDINLQKLVAAQSDVITIFGKTWDLHVTDALRISLEENLLMIQQSIEYLLKVSGKPLFYDAEHFFDGFTANAKYALATIKAAYTAGASRIILCDTNGGTLPHRIVEIVHEVGKSVPQDTLGIHAHNDGGVAVANTLAAVRSGCTQVQGTFNGIGERCGNADLTTVIPNLELKLQKRCLPKGNLASLTSVSKLIWERINVRAPLNQPFVGQSSFAHKGGVHVSAVQRNSSTYEHIAPELVGNSQRILISELSGRSNIRAKLLNRYPDLQDGLIVKNIVEDIQQRENKGYSYESAEASFELLVRRHLGKSDKFFKLHYYRIHGPKTFAGDNNQLIEASVKLSVDGEIHHCVAEGLGPVDALANSLAKALLPNYPILSKLMLTDFKVRVINSSDGTKAKVLVFIEHKFLDFNFGTLGVNENIIDASWEALNEAFKYSLVKCLAKSKLPSKSIDEAEACLTF